MIVAVRVTLMVPSMSKPIISSWFFHFHTHLDREIQDFMRLIILLRIKLVRIFDIHFFFFYARDRQNHIWVWITILIYIFLFWGFLGSFPRVMSLVLLLLFLLLLLLLLFNLLCMRANVVIYHLIVHHRTHMFLLILYVIRNLYVLIPGKWSILWMRSWFLFMEFIFVIFS